MKITEYKKKNGTTVYRASVYLGVDKITGKKVTTKITARTKKELKLQAQQEAIQFKQQGSTRFKAVTISSYEELALLWWHSYKHTVKENTKQTVFSMLTSHILPLFGSYRLDKLTAPLIQQIINELADKTNKGVHGAFLHYDKIHALNKRILQYGVTLQAIPFNPARDVTLPRNKQKEKVKKIKHFEPQELRRFLDYLDTLDLSKFKNMYSVTLYKLLLATGCRISETLALEWSDIDFDDATIAITKTLNYKKQVNSAKTKSSHRVIDIDLETVNLLRHYRSRQQQEALKLGRSETVVFSSFTETYQHRSTLLQRLRRHLKRANVPLLDFHAFRHTHASLLLNAGIPYKELQHRLGHATISMTMDIYSHLSKEKAKTAVSFYTQAIQSI